MIGMKFHTNHTIYIKHIFCFKFINVFFIIYMLFENFIKGNLNYKTKKIKLYLLKISYFVLFKLFCNNF